MLIAAAAGAGVAGVAPGAFGAGVAPGAAFVPGVADVEGDAIFGFVLLFLLFFFSSTFGVVGTRGITPGMFDELGGTVFLLLFLLLVFFVLLFPLFGVTAEFGTTKFAFVFLALLLFLGASQRITTELPHGTVISL